MLGGYLGAVFSKRAVLRPGVEADDAGGDARLVRGGRMGSPVSRGRLPVGAAEARGEGADALQADGEADLSDRGVGVTQQRRGALQPSRQQIGVRRLAEGAAELAAEVGAGKTGGTGEIVNAKWLEVTGIGQVLGAEKMTGWRDMRHAVSLGSAAL